MKLLFFLEMAIPMMAMYMKNIDIHIKDESVKIHSFDFPSKIQPISL